MPILLHEQSNQIADEGVVIGDKDNGMACPRRSHIRETDRWMSPVTLLSAEIFWSHLAPPVPLPCPLRSAVLVQTFILAGKRLAVCTKLHIRLSGSKTPAGVYDDAALAFHSKRSDYGIVESPRRSSD